MDISNAKHLPKDTAPTSPHANAPNQSPVGNTAKAALAVDPKSAGHVCTPACTHQGAKEGMSTPTGTKGTLHTTAAHDKTGVGAGRSGT
jgi:hypothetical protein